MNLQKRKSWGNKAEFLRSSDRVPAVAGVRSKRMAQTVVLNRSQEMGDRSLADKRLMRIAM